MKERIGVVKGTMPENLKPNRYKDLKKQHFPDKHFRQDHDKQGGKIFKGLTEKGALEEQAWAAAFEFLQDKAQNDRPKNFRPPAKALILAQSRPFEEWPIYKVSLGIQRYVFGCGGLSQDERKKYPRTGDPNTVRDIHGLTKNEFKTLCPTDTKGSRDNFFQSTGLPDYGFTNAQGLNYIFDGIAARYRGAEKKVENRNKKCLDRIKKLQEAEREVPTELLEAVQETAYYDTGHLKEPPGVNHNIYCYQSVKPYAYDPANPKKVKLLEGLAGYNLGPNVTIPIGVPDRLSIPKGQPGYVPEHQRVDGGRAGRIKPHKYGRVRKYDSADRAILAVISIGEDWVLLDLRGLLRNVFYRKLALKGTLTPTTLLKFFTGDPVISTKAKHVTFVYTLRHATALSRKPTPGRYSRHELEKITCSDGKVALVSVDLGQTNPVAARVSVVTQKNGKLQAEFRNARFLLPSMLDDIARYRNHSDTLEKELRQKAVGQLTEEQQREIVVCDADSAAKAKANLCVKYGVDPTEIPWESLDSRSTYIADYILGHGGDSSTIYFKTQEKGKRPKTVKRRDYEMSRQDGVRLKLAPATRTSLNEALWEQKRQSEDYHRLSQFKLELCRHIVTWLKKWATVGHSKIPVAFAVEDLNSRFFHGSGRRSVGWDSYFQAKRENRWFIQGLHKAFEEEALHHGSLVMEVPPARTSITCPIEGCGHCDPDNRWGEVFRCVRCGWEGHADLDVATCNIERVALTGRSIPKREQSGGAEIPEGARKPRKSRNCYSL